MTRPPGALSVTIVSQYFHPDFAATGQLLTELAVGLRRMGCEVFVCTTQPNYGPSQRARRYEIFEGVSIRRVFSTRLNKNTFAGRVLNSITFFASASLLLLTRPVSGPLIVGSNPPFLGLLGYVLNRARGQPYIYLVNDVYPDIAVHLGYLRADGLVRGIWTRLNQLTLRGAGAVVVLGDAMRSIVVKNAGREGTVRQDKFRIIHNWVDESFIRPMSKTENWFAAQHALQDKFVVLYAGNMGLAHDLESLIMAAGQLREKNIVFVFIGDGAKRRKLQEMAADSRLTNILFLPYQPRPVLPFLLGCSDVSIIAMESGIEGLVMPSKLYTTMASGRPIVALAEEHLEVSRIIRGAKCGTCVAPGNVGGLVEVLEHYYRDRETAAQDGRNGRRYCEDHFTLTRACREYHRVLEMVHEGRDRPRAELGGAKRREMDEEGREGTDER